MNADLSQYRRDPKVAEKAKKILAGMDALKVALEALALD